MIKDDTRKRLLAIEKKYDCETAIAVAKESLKVASKDKTFKQQFNGEVCETVLEMLLQKEAGERPGDFFYMKGVVLPDAETLSDFLTEIDFVIVTSTCVYCIECKSYAGDKVVSGNGTVTIKKTGKSRDVFAQNEMHLEVLDKLLRPFGKKPVYQMLLFDFSVGSITDERSERAKRIFPVVNEKSIVEYLRKPKSGIWDYDGLCLAKKKIMTFSEKNRSRHLKYVQGLHGGDDSE